MNDSTQCPHDAFRCCLYFSGNALSRSLERLASACFNDTGLSPSHGYLLKLVANYPDSTPSRLAEVLALAPSTITRFADALERKGLITRRAEGKRVMLQATVAGKERLTEIKRATDRLGHAFVTALGADGTAKLTQAVSNGIDALDAIREDQLLAVSTDKVT